MLVRQAAGNPAKPPVGYVPNFSNVHPHNQVALLQLRGRPVTSQLAQRQPSPYGGSGRTTIVAAPDRINDRLPFRLAVPGVSNLRTQQSVSQSALNQPQFRGASAVLRSDDPYVAANRPIDSGTVRRSHSFTSSSIQPASSAEVGNALLHFA